MTKVIQAIPINKEGILLFIKEFSEKDGKYYLKYRSMLNDIPFMKTEVFLFENNVLITGIDGTVLYRFPIEFLSKIAL